jgi:molecular chaperone GrpE
VADLEDRYLRMAAEFENYRKRTKREIERVRRAERDRVLLDWLEAVDNVERALAAAKSASGPWREGLSAIHRQMMKILERYTVEPMTSTGRPFDPTLHEAIATMPAPGVKDGTVYHTERRGYLYQDGRVLRPAQVVVARG